VIINVSAANNYGLQASKAISLFSEHKLSSEECYQELRARIFIVIS
jgi:hypothetical protein